MEQLPVQDPYKVHREEMVTKHIAARGVSDANVLEAMKRIPRELFVDSFKRPLAYEDFALPIEEGQTISQPFIVAWMAEQAQLKPEDIVLEIGTGSGYSTAILSQLSSHVYSVERYPSLAETAIKRLMQLNCSNTSILIGDGTLGWKDHAPYDAIIVTAGGPKAPPTLLDQLKVGGRLIIPLGPTIHEQQLMRVTKMNDQEYTFHSLGAVRFVPLIGEEGWSDTF